jgi:hypothetical protein
VNDSIIVLGNRNSQLIVYDLDNLVSRYIINIQNTWAFSLTFLNNERVIFYDTTHKKTFIYSLISQKLVDIIPNYNSYLENAIYDGEIVFSVNNGILFFFWETSSFKTIPLLDDIISPIFDVSGELIAARDMDDNIIVFEKNNMIITKKFTFLPSEVDIIVFISSNYLACSFKDDSQIGIWEIKSGKRVFLSDKKTEITTVTQLIYYRQKNQLIASFFYLYNSIPYSEVEIWEFSI